MKSLHVEEAGHPSRAWLWKIVFLAGTVGLGTWLLLTALVPSKLPEDYPKPPDLQSQSEALRKVLSDADAQARSHPNSSDDTGRLAMAYHANQFYELAEAAYGIALRLAPSDYRWPYCLALAREETGRDKEVHDLLQKTLQLKADYMPALQKLADIYYKQDRLDEAARYYELSARSGGKDSSLQALFGLGRIAARRKEWNKAIEFIAPLSQEHAQLRPLHQLLLDAYEALGQTEKAAEERRFLLEPALIVIPLVKDPLGEELLALSCSSTRLLKEAGLMSRFRKPDDAIRVARRAVEVEPGDADAHHLLARTMLEAHGDNPEAVSEALAHLNDGLRLRPDDLLPLWYFAVAFFRQEKTDAAVEQLRVMLANNSKNEESHYYLGLVADRQGRRQEAVAQYQEALKGGSNHAEACHKLGLIRVQEGKLDEAIAYFETAVRLKPMFTMARSNLGVALDTKGKTGQAVEQFEEALRLKPNDATIHAYLAIALIKLGRIEEAEDHFREALHLTPGDAEAHYGLGCALAMQRKADQAAEEFRQALRLRPNYPEAANELRKLERIKP